MATTGDGTGAPPLPQVTYASRITSSGTVQVSSGTGSRAAARVKRTQQQAAKSATDQSGTNLNANDASGFGLNRPFHLWNVYPTTSEAAPPVSTTSGSFASLHTISSEPQHPKLRVRVRVVNGAGTSAEVRLIDRASGAAISSTLVVGSAATVESDLDGTLVSPTLSGSGAPMRVDVQARRTGGANTVAVLVMHAFGKGT